MCSCGKLKEIEEQLNLLKRNQGSLTNDELLYELKRFRKIISKEIIAFKNNNPLKICSECSQNVSSIAILIGSFSLN